MISCKTVSCNVKAQFFANVQETKEKKKASHYLSCGDREESESVDLDLRTYYPTQSRGLITYKRKWVNEVISNLRNLEYDSEDSFDELMTYPTSSSRRGNEEDDVTFDLDEDDLDE
ncbi:hypothetical protein DVH24_019682 [Malus domestica]|uniref:Uncharacterized protein n=1 Tax=Malus domestica TaxID=3750 RepID=A0A498I3P1_MALDO|nr:hypothetical protein DVH24_019682 [Malus domestica]